MLSETNTEHEKDVGTKNAGRGQNVMSGTGRNRLNVKVL